jgi:hypothetical protein
MELGLIEVNLGAGFEAVTIGLLTVNVFAALVPPSDPPAAYGGLVTVIEYVPTLAISDAGTAAVSAVLLTKVVVKATPTKYMVAPLTKFEPVAANEIELPPAVTVDGEIDESVGVGFVGAALTVKV